MNDRIRELAEQAGFITTPNTDVIKNNHWGGYMDGRQFEKFAELLVFECVKAVMDGTKEGDHYAQRIEQHFDDGQGGILHFGVEE